MLHDLVSEVPSSNPQNILVPVNTPSTMSSNSPFLASPSPPSGITSPQVILISSSTCNPPTPQVIPISSSNPPTPQVIPISSTNPLTPIDLTGNSLAKSFHCTHCSKVYLHRQSLQKHIKNNHAIESTSRIHCQENSCE